MKITSTDKSKQDPQPTELTSPENNLPQTSQETKSDEQETKSASFFKDRTITDVIKSKPICKFVPPFLAGNLLKKSITSVLTEQSANKKSILTISKTTTSDVPVSIVKKAKSSKKQITTSVKMSGNSNSSQKSLKPVPSTSAINKKGRAVNLDTEDESDDSSTSDEDKCCVCGDWQPEAIRECHSIIFVNWAKCDYCTHWTHLQYCSEVRVVGRGDEFRCPHCLIQQQ